MSLKKIFFLADSAVNLFNLYESLKEFYSIYWVVYNEDVANELKKKEINPEKILLIDSFNFLKILKKHRILYKVLKTIITKFFNSFQKKILISKIQNIDNKHEPDFWITDTGSVLSKVKTQSPKCTFKHSVCYKNYYLNENIFDYDYVFLPGKYHYDRILKFWKNKINEKEFKKLIVAGSLKVSPYVKKKTLSLEEKTRLTNKFNLSSNKINVLFAPSHDAYGFGSGRFLSKQFGNQFKSLSKISDFVNNDLDGNFIIKLHHFQFSLLKNSEIKKIAKKKNNYVFKESKYFDAEESEDVIRFADIIISDISGVGPTGIFLGKKVIFMDPYSKFDWGKCDMESDYRPGFICKSFDDLFDSLIKYKNSDKLFELEKNKFVNEIFFNHKSEPTKEISTHLKKIVK